MERNLNQPNPEETCQCAICGEEFEQPLLAELHSGSMIEEYYACPRCLTKVGEVDHERRMEAEETEEEDDLPIQEPSNIEAAKTEEAPPCPYQLGYLRKRDKSTPIPESCFTCTKMIECI